VTESELKVVMKR